MFDVLYLVLCFRGLSRCCLRCGIFWRCLLLWLCSCIDLHRAISAGLLGCLLNFCFFNLLLDRSHNDIAITNENSVSMLNTSLSKQWIILSLDALSKCLVGEKLNFWWIEIESFFQLWKWNDIKLRKLTWSLKSPKVFLEVISNRERPLKKRLSVINVNTCSWNYA